MNGYEDLRAIHRLAQEAVVTYDSGEVPSRSLLAEIRESAGKFPKYGNDNEYIGFARSRHRGDNQRAYLSLCDSDAEGAFKIYRHPNALIERLQAENAAMSEALAKAGHADDCTHNWTDGDMCDCHLKHLPDAVARGKKLLELERRDTPASILRHSGFRSFACKCGGFPEQDSKFCGECGSRLEWV